MSDFFSDDFDDGYHDSDCDYKEHPDYTRLANAGLWVDANMSEIGSNPVGTMEFLATIVDTHPFIHVSRQRVTDGILATIIGGGPLINLQMLAWTSFIDGFLLGVKFEKEGGHIKDPR